MTYLTDALFWQLDYCKFFTMSKSTLLTLLIAEIIFEQISRSETKFRLQIFKVLSGHFQIASLKSYIYSGGILFMYTAAHTYIFFYIYMFMMQGTIIIGEIYEKCNLVLLIKFLFFQDRSAIF